MIGATTTPMPKTAIAMPRLAGGKLSMRIACDKGCSAPPAAPCTTRAKTRKPSVVAAPQAAEASVKKAMQAIRNRFRPKKPAQPAGHRQHDGVGDQVAGQDPGGLVGAGRQVAGDVRNRHVGHRGIEDFQDRGQHHRRGDEPRIDAGFPGESVRRERFAT